MDDIDPKILLEKPETEASKIFILNTPADPEAEYTQVAPSPGSRHRPSLGIVRPHPAVLGRQRRPGLLREEQRVPAHRLRQIVRFPISRRFSRAQIFQENKNISVSSIKWTWSGNRTTIPPSRSVPSRFILYSILSLQDILRCRVMTTGIFETKFEVDKVRFQ